MALATAVRNGSGRAVRAAPNTSPLAANATGWASEPMAHTEAASAARRTILGWADAPSHTTPAPSEATSAPSRGTHPVGEPPARTAPIADPTERRATSGGLRWPARNRGGAWRSTAPKLMPAVWATMMLAIIGSPRGHGGRLLEVRREIPLRQRQTPPAEAERRYLGVGRGCGYGSVDRR